MIPRNTLCGDTVPTVELEGSGPELLLLVLAVMNSFVLDYVARKRVALHMSLTLVDSLPLPRTYAGTPLERGIARRALLLTATGTEMAAFWRETATRLGFDPNTSASVEDLEQRRQLRAELDVLVARDLYRLTKDEMAYLLDPGAILGPDCGFETFGALKRAEEREGGGRFLTRDLILQTWDRLPRPAETERRDAGVDEENRADFDQRR